MLGKNSGRVGFGQVAVRDSDQAVAGVHESRFRSGDKLRIVDGNIWQVRSRRRLKCLRNVGQQQDGCGGCRQEEVFHIAILEHQNDRGGSRADNTQQRRKNVSGYPLVKTSPALTWRAQRAQADCRPDPQSGSVCPLVLLPSDCGTAVRRF